MSKISLIVAMTPEGVIGHNNQLLWHLPNDFKYFKATTLGKPIIMGRKTFESIGKPLPGRRNIILTTQKDFTVPECITVHTVEQALAAAGDVPEIMVIGGGEIYQLFYPLAQTLYITYVDADLKGNTRFVPIDPKQWREIDRQEFAADEKHQYAYSFVTLARIAS